MKFIAHFRHSQTILWIFELFYLNKFHDLLIGFCRLKQLSDDWHLARSAYYYNGCMGCYCNGLTLLFLEAARGTPNKKKPCNNFISWILVCHMQTTRPYFFYNLILSGWGDGFRYPLWHLIHVKWPTQILFRKVKKNKKSWKFMKFQVSHGDFAVERTKHNMKKTIILTLRNWAQK